MTILTCRIMYSFLSCLIFLKLFDRVSCTYTYLLADLKTKEAVLIDPVIDLAERDAKLIKNLGFTLKFSGKLIQKL